MKLQVDEEISLEFLEEIHAESLCNLVNDNRAYLREWLPWVDNMKAVTDFRQYIINCRRQAANKTDLGFAIVVNRNIAGRIGLHHLNHQNKIGEIGYWLAGEMQGRGIVTRCCNALIRYGFKELGLNRIEIKCGLGNSKSMAIAEKLHFSKEGVLKKAEWLNGEFIDLQLFALLKDEWKAYNNR